MKASWRDLAVMGGAPEFAEPRVVGRPNVVDEEVFFTRLREVFASRQFSNNGPFVQAFEARIAELVGVRHCIATCNATLALELAIDALGITGSAIVPSFTFIATAHALQRRGVTPIFCEVHPRTHNIDPAAVEPLIRSDTTAIVGVHLWGRACAIEELEGLARRHGLRLLFDAAHAFGGTYRGRMIGGFGDAEVFSFHATKAINSFEGGAVVTDDDSLAAELRSMVQFGLDKGGRVARAGTNAKMSEPCAAMGLTSLEGMTAIFDHNRTNADAYRARLGAVPGLVFPELDPREMSNHQFVAVAVEPEAFGLSRDALMGVLAAENVIARGYFTPGCHRCEPYGSEPRIAAPNLPVTDRLSETVMCLPTGLSVTEHDVARICRIIALAAAAGPELSARVRASEPA